MAQKVYQIVKQFDDVDEIRSFVSKQDALAYFKQEINETIVPYDFKNQERLQEAIKSGQVKLSFGEKSRYENKYARSEQMEKMYLKTGTLEEQDLEWARTKQGHPDYKHK